MSRPWPKSLDAAGYHTGFVADVPHYFVPGMNFTRGFRQWQFVRGQAEDRLGAEVHGRPGTAAALPRAGIAGRHLVNVRPQAAGGGQWPTARTFRWAQRFLEQNAGGGKPLYLYVDSFTPHETWEAPLHYYDLYGSRAEREPVWLSVPYGPLADVPDLVAQLPSVRANYAGLVTMVDHWCGRLLDAIDRLGIADRTMVLFFSDHGTNFADNPEGIVGKPAGWMYPGTMDIPLLLRLPDGRGAGSECDRLASTADIPATVAEAAGRPRAAARRHQPAAPPPAAPTQAATTLPAATATSSGTATRAPGSSAAWTSPARGCSTSRPTRGAGTMSSNGCPSVQPRPASGSWPTPTAG